MASFTPVYINITGEQEHVEPVVRKALSSIGITSGVAIRANEGPWVQVGEREGGDIDFFDPMVTAKKLSSVMATEAISLWIETSVGSIDYRHFQNGDEVRALAFGTGEPSMDDDGEFVYPDEGTWSVVKGKPQPWEETALWNASTTAEMIDEGDADRKARFETRTIRVGDDFPFMSTFTPGEELELPGFKERQFKWETSV